MYIISYVQGTRGRAMEGTKKERKARSRSANAADSDNTRALSYRYACVSVQETG